MAEENYNENTDTLNNSEIKVPSYSCKKNSVDQLLCYYLKEKKIVKQKQTGKCTLQKKLKYCFKHLLKEKTYVTIQYNN